jgi:hypothetical protein
MTSFSELARVASGEGLAVGAHAAFGEGAADAVIVAVGRYRAERISRAVAADAVVVEPALAVGNTSDALTGL